MPKHYIAGSGMAGCLYDYCSGACDTYEEAVNDILSVFGDSCSERDEEGLRSLLTVKPSEVDRSGVIYGFHDTQEAGAHYAEITSCDCDDPSQHGED